MSLKHQYHLLVLRNAFYDKFDEDEANYSSVNSLKCNGEHYVGCCGIFDFDERPDIQANRAVNFCLDILKTIEAINLLCGTFCKLRIGVNMGGPLTGCVPNLMKPTFDILGMPVEIANLMHSDGKIGAVQIVEEVVAYLSASEFNIIEGMSFDLSSGEKEMSFVVTRAF